MRRAAYLENRNAAHTEQWLGRIGINSGPVIGSIVGIQKYVYDIFGRGVNLAARMEAFAEPMTITLCENTFELPKDKFTCTEIGEADIRSRHQRIRCPKALSIRQRNRRPTVEPVYPSSNL